jgi:predicted RNA-binding Zn-ribbon protein involved in translation (DUF1610 family)
MKRWMLKLGLLVVGGAIINVAVAWGISEYSLHRYQNEMVSCHFVAFIKMREGRVRSDGQIGVDGYTLSQIQAMPIDEAFQHFRSVGLRFETKAAQEGFDDFRSVGFHYRYTANRNGEHVSALRTGLPLKCIAGPVLWQRLNSMSFEMRHPLWPGFAINTIFYAAILWVLFAAPGAVRRRLRRKRGQCAACGYSLRDITSGKCPECGERRPQRMNNGPRTSSSLEAPTPTTNLPHIAWYERLLSHSTYLALVIYAMILIMSPPTRTRILEPLAYTALTWVFIFILEGFRTRHKRNLQRRLQENDYLLCLRCRYPLKSLSSDGKCPECGERYWHHKTAEKWKRSWPCI